MEEMDFIVGRAKEGMNQALEHLEKEMLNLRAGKANPIMLSSVKVDYYGTMTSISQVANINSPDGRTLTVQPWEKVMLQEIEKAILIAESSSRDEADNIFGFEIAKKKIVGDTQLCVYISKKVDE